MADASREASVQRSGKPADLVVISPLKDWSCAGCAGTGDFLIMDDTGPLCLTCADLDHLTSSRPATPALTWRAKQASKLSASIQQAEEQCLADEEIRLRRRDRDKERRAKEDVEFQARMAGEITRLYPGCPKRRAAAIAEHAALRGSGRVGRSAAARALDERAITLAVVASVRHEDTDHDELLMSGMVREDARDQVRPVIDQVLGTWAN